MQSPNISTYPTISPAALKQHEMALRIRVFRIEPTAKHKHLTVTAEGSIHFELVLSQAYPLAAGLTQAQAKQRAKTLLKELHDNMEAGKSKRDSTSPLDFPPDMPNLFHLQHLKLQNVEPVYSEGQVHPAKPKLVEYWKATFYHRMPVGKGTDGKTIYATTAGQYLSFTFKKIIHSLDAQLLPIYTAATRALQLPHGAVFDTTTAVIYRLFGNVFLPVLRTTEGEVPMCEGAVRGEIETPIKVNSISGFYIGLFMPIKYGDPELIKTEKISEELGVNYIFPLSTIIEKSDSQLINDCIRCVGYKNLEETIKKYDIIKHSDYFLIGKSPVSKQIINKLKLIAKSIEYLGRCAPNTWASKIFSKLFNSKHQSFLFRYGNIRFGHAESLGNIYTMQPQHKQTLNATVGVIPYFPNGELDTDDTDKESSNPIYNSQFYMAQINPNKRYIWYIPSENKYVKFSAAVSILAHEIGHLWELYCREMKQKYREEKDNRDCYLYIDGVEVINYVLLENEADPERPVSYFFTASQTQPSRRITKKDIELFNKSNIIATEVIMDDYAGLLKDAVIFGRKFSAKEWRIYPLIAQSWEEYIASYVRNLFAEALNEDKLPRYLYDIIVDKEHLETSGSNEKLLEESVDDVINKDAPSTYTK